MELIDGFDTLPEDAAEKVKRALEQGHVDDEDWNGVCLTSTELPQFLGLTHFAGRRMQPLYGQEGSGDVSEG